MWLILATLHPALPTLKNPVIFYSNHLHDDLKMVVLQALKQAKSSISLQIYGLTDPDILQLLERKKAEGIEVKIFYDKNASKNIPPSLEGFPIQTNGLMHRKILIIDQERVLIGTANFTTQSLKMHGNLIAGIWDAQLARFLQDSIESSGMFHVGSNRVTSYLLPDEGCTAIEQLEAHLDRAEESIQVAIFTLTHPRIIAKLIQAQNRGVRVVVIVDRYTALGASKKGVKALENAGVQLFFSQGDQLLHHKWALVDGKTLIMGSANWTAAAFNQNQDCMLVFEELSPSQQKILKKLWKSIAIASQKR